MTMDLVCAVAEDLAGFHERFASYFGRRETQSHSWVYLNGLLLGEGRKNGERIALQFAKPPDGGQVTQNEVLALQNFLTDSPWDHGPVQREIQAVFAERLAPSTSRWSLGTVGVIDESGFAKSGLHSVGAARQYSGRLGKVDVCQVGVFLLGATPDGHALLDHQLYLPEDWAKDKQRRNKTRVPKDIKFQTKPELAAEMVRRTHAAGHVALDWITADAVYGDNGKLLDALEDMHQRYVMAISPTNTFFNEDPATQIPEYRGRGRRPSRAVRDAVRSAKALLAALPEEAWTAIKLREGACGPLVFEFARMRVWAVRDRQAGPPIWLVFQRSLDDPGEVKFWVSNADESTSLLTLAEVGAVRWNVEQFFEEGKGNFGMADYESRSWTSWHHHMSLVAMAHLFVTEQRLKLNAAPPIEPANVPRDTAGEPLRITLPAAIRLMRSALERPTLSLDDAIHLTEYHLRRNQIARNSHRKTWLRKHKGVKT